jgi:Tfp pilus assembly protein PilN
MQAVNLLPADARLSKKGGFTSVGSDLPGKKTMQIGGGIAAVLALLLAGLYVHERSVVSGKQSTLSSDTAKLAAVQVQVDAIRTAQTESQARDAAVESVVNTRMNWDRTMSALAKVLPVDVVLNELQAAAPVTAATAAAETAATAAPTTGATTGTTSTTTTSTPPTAPVVAAPSVLTIAGVAPSNVHVATVMDRLSLLPWLSSVSLVSSTRQPDGTTSFSISAGVSEVH